MPSYHFYFETMAGTHLSDAVRALRDSGSADTLYEAGLRAIVPAEIDFAEFSIAGDTAQGLRVTYSRRALLFAAFAAEAYANDFLFDHCAGQDRDALERLSTVDKYVLLPKLLQGAALLERGREPLQTVHWLFQRRDELVHAKPQGRDLTYDPDNHNPEHAARCIIAVAQAAAALVGTPQAGSMIEHVNRERGFLERYGRTAAEVLPGIHDEPQPTDLLLAAGRNGGNH